MTTWWNGANSERPSPICLRISWPRVEWVGQHADLPIEDVALDTEVAPKVIQAVLAAQ